MYSIIIKHYLEVKMRNIFAVHVFDTQKDLFDEVGGFPLR